MTVYFSSTVRRSAHKLSAAMLTAASILLLVFLCIQPTHAIEIPDSLTISSSNGSWDKGTGVFSVTYGKTGTLTLKNTSGKNAILTLEYQYEIESGYNAESSVDICGTKHSVSCNRVLLSQSATGNGSTGKIDMSPNDSKEVTLIAGKGTKAGGRGSAKIIITKLDFTPENTVTTTFEPSIGGSYTVDGKIITTPVTETRQATEAYQLKATPDGNHKFLGWYTSEGEFLSANADDTFTIKRDSTVTAKFIAKDVAMFRVDVRHFDDLDAAAAYALNNNQSKITLVSSGTITGQHTIPAGVTLLIPHDATGTLYTTTPSPVTDQNLAFKEYRALTMASGSSITVNGAISVGGQYFAAGGGQVGGMVGGYGNIKMAESSRITIKNGGALYAWGFITGSGGVTVESGGTAYEWFQITDFRGGTASMSMANTILTRSKRVFLFSQYYVQNVEVPLTINSGAAEKVYASVNAGGSINNSAVDFIGASGMFNVTGGSITKSYDPAKDRMTYRVNGHLEVSGINISLPVVGEVDSKAYFFPITNNTSLLIESGSVTVKQRLALLPGVEVKIAQGADLTIASDVPAVVYDRDEWMSHDFVYQGKHRSVRNTPTRTYNWTDEDLKDVKIDVNGSITVNGAMYTTAGGADICSSEGTGVYKQVASPGTETKTQQCTQGADSKIDFVNITITPAKLHNADGTYTETNSKPAQTTINYILGMWDGTPATVTFNANGGAGEMDVQEITSFNSPLNACAFTRLGYTFAGWKDSDGKTYENGAAVNLTSGSKLELTAQWTVNTYTITVKSDANGSPIADVSLDGPGTGYKITEWGSDKQITIIAPEKQGFTFKGWYKEDENYNGAPLSTDLVVKKSLTDLLDAGMADDKNVISLVAVYESKEETNLTLTLKDAPAGVTVNEETSTSNTWSVPVGVKVTITVGKQLPFYCWTNANDKVMTTSNSYSFTMATNMQLTMMSSQTRVIAFCSADGRLLKAEMYSGSEDEEPLVFPAAPYRVGYMFDSWKVNGTTVRTLEEIEEAARGAGATITVTATYKEIIGDDYAVSAYQVVDGVQDEAISGTSTYNRYVLGEIAKFTAPDKSSGGSSFRFWASDKDGTNILSFSTTYSFRVTQKTDIYAIYGGENKPEVQPVVRVDNVLTGNENNVNSLTFMIGANVPTGYELVEMGALYTKDVDSGNDTTLRVENVGSSGVYKAVSRLKHEPNLTDYSYALGFNMTKNPDTTIYLRGYVAVRKTDSTDNTIYYYYSGVRLASYNNPNGTNS